METVRQLGPAGLAQQALMAQIGRGFEPLVGARQRRQAALGLEIEGMAQAAMVEVGVEGFQLRRQKAPIVQHLLQPGGDAAGVMGLAQVARDQHELAVAGTILVGGKFHRW